MVVVFWWWGYIEGMSGWKNIEDEFPHLFEGEATSSANIPVYPVPMGPMLRPAVPEEDIPIPDEYLEFLGLKKRPGE